MWCLVLFTIYLLVFTISCNSIWMPKEAAQWAVKEFEILESIRSNISFRGTDRRASVPFISGNDIIFSVVCFINNSIR